MDDAVVNATWGKTFWQGSGIHGQHGRISSKGGPYRPIDPENDPMINKDVVASDAGAVLNKTWVLEEKQKERELRFADIKAKLAYEEMMDADKRPVLHVGMAVAKPLRSLAFYPKDKALEAAKIKVKDVVILGEENVNVSLNATLAEKRLEYIAKVRAKYNKLLLGEKSKEKTRVIAQFEDYMLFHDISLENMKDLWKELTESELWFSSFKKTDQSKAEAIYKQALKFYDPQFWVR
jgi:hypothetical protein